MNNPVFCWKRHLRDLLIVIGIGVVLTLTLNGAQFVWSEMKSILGYSAFLGMGLWKGNEFITYSIQRIFPWRQNRRKTYLMMWAALVIYSLLFVLLFNFGWSQWVDDIAAPYFWQKYKLTIIIEFLISLGVSGIMYTSIFFTHWKTLVVEHAEMERVAAEAKLTALQNQVNPHFLFNCMNTLNSLVFLDADKASRFIGDLSKVYRYVMEQQDVVKLEEELQFCKAYLALEQVRFGNKLDVHFDLNPDETCYVMRMGVQLVIENAIKHNEISNERHLLISLSREGNMLLVRNNLQPKTSLPNSARKGQWNLIERYRLIGAELPQFTGSETHYEARIPLIAENKKPTK